MTSSRQILTALLCLMSQVCASDDITEVICPDFDSSDSATTNIPTPFYSQIYSKESNTEFCRCQLHVTRSGKTAIIKCDFNFQKSIKLTKNIFPFKQHEATSAYVRMTNCNGAIITADFLYNWMQAPSSAIDIWSCGHLKFDSAPEPVAFDKIQTFIGTGIVNCSMDEFPSYFLRDRTRGALRFKDCKIGTIRKGVFHNITEMRYLVLEASDVDQIEGPLSTSGVIQLSRKSMHSWDGLEIINSTVKSVAPYSFSISHKSDMEDMIIRGSTFGYVGTGAFNVTGDIKVDITANTFHHIDSMALKISVTGPMTFVGNNIQDFQSDSLSDLDCHTDSSMINNTFFVHAQTTTEDRKSPFKTSCGTPKVAYLVKAKESATHAVVYLTIIGILFVGVFLAVVIYGVRTKAFMLYKLKRHETPLCDEEMVSEPEEGQQRTTC